MPNDTAYAYHQMTVVVVKPTPAEHAQKSQHRSQKHFPAEKQPKSTDVEYILARYSAAAAAADGTAADTKT